MGRRGERPLTLALPPLPPRGQLADFCREAAARENVQPDLVEKDFYLTRLLWALGTHFEERLLLKGGTLLSKVDLGFFRMSEDADFVLPVAPSRARGSNVRQLNQVRDALKTIAPAVGLTTRFPGGQLYEKGSHAVWELDYTSEFGPQAVRVEASLRPPLRSPRRVLVKQLLAEPLAGDYTGAQCWALDAQEARAEKVRAAFTRDAIRDFYDLERLAGIGADLASPPFIALVDMKLGELGAPPLNAHRAVFGLTAARMKTLRRQMDVGLAAVLRSNAPRFDLERMLATFAEIWGLPDPFPSPD